MCLGSFVAAMSFFVYAKSFGVTTMPNGLCLTFFQEFHFDAIFQVVTWSVVMCQFLSTLAIILQHLALLHRLQKSNMPMLKLGARNDKSLKLQLLLLTASAVLCWIPANVIYIYSILMPKYPVILPFWTIACILPINSIVYPAVFVGVIAKKLISSKQLAKLKK